MLNYRKSSKYIHMDSGYDFGVLIRSALCHAKRRRVSSDRTANIIIVFVFIFCLALFLSNLTSIQRMQNLYFLHRIKE